MEGDDDDDIQVVYENCNNVEWKAAREDLRIQYKKVVQSSGKCHPSSNDKSAHSGYRGYQNLRQSSGDDFIDSRPSSSTTSETEASNTGTDGIPLSVKMELIDAINGEESSSSVELLQDDSDSTISIEAETRNGDSMPRTEYAEIGTLFSCKENLSDSDEEYYETAQSRNSTISETCSADQFFMDIQGSNRTSTPATSSRKNGLVMQSPSAPTAAQIWREAHRSSMSTCSTDSEYSSQLQYFEAESGSKSVASSFVGGVDRMRIGDDDCRSPSRTPRPISHDEVSSTSDLFEKQVTGMDDELALAARWAEDHDLRIDDGDEFLECEDEDPPTPRGAPTNSKESRRTEEKSNRKTGSPNKYRCRSHKRTSSLPKASDRDKTAKSQVDHRNATKPFSATRESRENIRKRNSSPILRRRSSSRSRGQERKRFASDRSHEKRRGRRQPHCRESSPRPNRTRTSVAGQRLSATSALRAHNLPRYKPVDRRYDFTRWIDSNGELVLHKVKDVATGLVSAPLGCTYDSALDTFVFTRHDSFESIEPLLPYERQYLGLRLVDWILFSTSDGRILDNLTLVGFDQPCAICILRPGAAMGILDRSNLYLYEPKLNRLSIIASNLAARHRALTYNCNGDLITVKKFGVQLSATIFDATEHNRIIGSFVFPLSDGASAAINERQPCFADSSGSQMFFTDLRTNTLTCMEMVGNRMERIYSRCMQQLPAHRGEEALKRFVFMSGIRCDDFGHLLVADAKTHTLKLLTTSGQMLKCARFANGASFPYCSSFGVSPSGMLMACDRGNNRMVLFRIGEESISEDAVITDDVFDRMIGTSGVENEINRLKERARRAR